MLPNGNDKRISVDAYHHALGYKEEPNCIEIERYIQAFDEKRSLMTFLVVETVSGKHTDSKTSVG